MSGAGAPDLSIDATGVRVAVIASSWHTEIMDGLIAGAQRALADSNVTDVALVRAPGSFELPILCQAYARAGYDAVIALGVIIRGGTPHFDYVCAAATDGLNRVALDHTVPVGFGLLTCDDEQQALDRAGLDGSHEDKGYEAAAAALATARVLGDVRATPVGPALVDAGAVSDLG